MIEAWPNFVKSVIRFLFRKRLKAVEIEKQRQETIAKLREIYKDISPEELRKTTPQRPSIPPSTKTEKVKIILWQMYGAALIIPCETGVFYTNQVGGYAVDHPEMEGILIPVTTGGSAQNTSNACPISLELLEFFFYGPKWKGRCDGGIDEETAEFLDTLFQKYEQTKYLRVNRKMLSESKEAWIYVDLYYPESKNPIFSGIDAKSAVLTWPNSD